MPAQNRDATPALDASNAILETIAGLLFLVAVISFFVFVGYFCRPILFR